MRLPPMKMYEVDVLMRSLLEGKKGTGGTEPRPESTLGDLLAFTGRDGLELDPENPGDGLAMAVRDVRDGHLIRADPSHPRLEVAVVTRDEATGDESPAAALAGVDLGARLRRRRQRRQRSEFTC